MDFQIFYQRPGRKVEIESTKKQGIKYRIQYEWNEVGINHRLKEGVTKQRKEIKKKCEVLNSKIQILETEKATH